MTARIPLAAFTLPAIAVLIALGVWQLRRLEQSRDRSAEQAAAAAAPVLTLSAADLRRTRPELKTLAYRRAVLDGLALPGQTLYLYAPSPAGPVWHSLVPVKLPGGEAVLVLSQKGRAQKPLAHNAPPRPVRIEGVVRLPSPPSIFDPDPDPAANIWFRPDPSAMTLQIAPAAGITQLAEFWIETGPAPAPPRRIPHLQYALTWFALAVVAGVSHIAFTRTRPQIN